MSKFKVKTIDHLVLRTKNLQAMLAFYQEVLGCTIVRSELDELGLVQLRAGDSLIDVITVDGELGQSGGEAPGKTGRNLDHFCLQLQKISNQDLAEYLKSAGIEQIEFANRNGAQGFGHSVYIPDPDGNIVELKSEI